MIEVTKNIKQICSKFYQKNVLHPANKNLPLKEFICNTCSE